MISRIGHPGVGGFGSQPESLPTIIPWIHANRLPLTGQASVFREQFRAGTAGP